MKTLGEHNAIVQDRVLERLNSEYSPADSEKLKSMAKSMGVKDPPCPCSYVAPNDSLSSKVDVVCDRCSTQMVDPSGFIVDTYPGMRHVECPNCEAWGHYFVE